MIRPCVITLVVTILAVIGAPASGQTLSFVDAEGLPATGYLDNTTATLRLDDATANFDSGALDTVLVALSTQLAGDAESLTLTETTVDSGVFEGSIGLATSAAPSLPGILETWTDAGPPFVRDTLQADYAAGAAVTSVDMVGSLTRFVDTYGEDSDSVPTLDRAYLRVIDPAADNPNTRDTAEVTVTALGSGDSEQLFLAETGLATGTFEGSVDLGPGPVANDGALDAAVGETLEARHPHLSDPDDSSDQTSVVGSQTTLVDAAGEPLDKIFEGTTAYLRVIDHGANTDPLSTDFSGGQIAAYVSGDSEAVSLTETGVDTGVFEGSMPLDSTILVVFGNGILETAQIQGPPVAFDLVLATHTDASGQSLDSAPTIGGSIEFIDASGNAVSSYADGSTVYLRVEDHDTLDYVYVDVSTTAGDFESVFLVGPFGSGVLEGSIQLQPGVPAAGYDGSLQAQPGGQITATFYETFGYSTPTAVADIEAEQLSFIDENGMPTQTFVEGGTAGVRLFSAADNLNPAFAETVTISLSSEFGGDSESLLLTETDVDSNVFEGSIALANLDPGIPGNGVLETAYGDPPPSAEFDTLTATSASDSATASMVGSRTLFIDAFGNEAETFVVGDVAYVRVIDYTANDPFEIDTVQPNIASLTTGDATLLDLQETGFDTGVFEGSVGLGLNSRPFGILLDVSLGETIEVVHYNSMTLGVSVDQATLTGSAVHFVDSAGESASEVLQGAPAYVRVIDPAADQSPSIDQTSVQLTSEKTGDVESLTLIETGPETGVFEGSISTRLGSATPGDGILDTNEDMYAAERLDTLTATYNDPSGQSIATIQTIGSRLAFIDSVGNETGSYATGSRAYIRVEDQNVNDPGVGETVMITVTSGTGDSLDFYLFETGIATGIFEGSVRLNNDPSPDPFNGSLETQAGIQINASHAEAAGSSAFASADIIGTAVDFIDEAGLPTAELLESHVARVRVTSVGDNADPGAIDSLLVTLTSDLAADSESLLLLETGPSTGIFEGEISTLWVDPVTSSGILGNGVLETTNTYIPLSLPDQVTVSFGSFSATATMISGRLTFVDVFGQETEVYADGDRIYIRVISYAGSDPGYAELAFGELSVLGGGDIEGFQLTETGFDTSVFEGSFPLGAGGSNYDGLLDAVSGDQIQAMLYPYSGTSPSPTDLATIGGSATFFVDAEGELALEYLQGAQAHVRVIAHGVNQNPTVAEVTSAQVVSEVTGDVETMSLVETGPDTGVFEGSIATRLGTATPGDGFLDTNENPAALERLDTLTATYTDAFGQSSATARTIGSRMVFIDSAGNETAAYATGSMAYVRVEDQNANDPGIGEVVMVRLSSSVGDDLDVYLFETDKATGIFEGSLQLNDNPSADSFNGSLETQAGGEINASYSEAAGSSSFASAAVTGSAVEFIDADGVPTSELLESHVARVRVTSLSDNVDPGASDSLTVSLSTLYTADSESLLLQETGGNTSTFEGEITLSFVDPSTGTGTPGNGVVETSNSYTPAFLADQVTASFAGQSATATTVAQRLFFIDIFGQDTEFYAESGMVYLRIINHTINDPGSIDSIDVALSVLGAGGDIEQVILDETGFDTAVFEGSLDLGPGATQFDGQLDASAGDQIEARRASSTSTLPDAVDLAMVGGSEIFFTDSAGQLTAEYLQGARVFVQVIAHGANQSPGVDVTSAQLSSEHTGDVETMSLVETGPDTGVFEGAFDTRLGNATPGDGYLDTNENPAALERLDTLTASYSDPFGQSFATARTIGSRMVFIDSAGNETAAYATGSMAYVRVEDQNANDPGLGEAVMVRLSSNVGDDLDVYLLETGKATGIFEGSLQLNDNPSPDSFNGSLETQAGGDIYASYSEAAGSSSSASAVITGTAVEFIDAAGVPTSELLESHVARVRVTSLGDNVDPGTSDSLTVSLDALYTADSESLLLQETGGNTNVFEGEIALSFVDPSTGTGTPGNGVVETSNSYTPAFLADQVTASFAGQSATATTVAQRLFFIDIFGESTEIYAESDTVYLRLINHTINDPGSIDSIDAAVSVVGGGDVEQVILDETGFDTAVFEGSVVLGPGATQFDGQLDASAGDQIEAVRASTTSTLPDAVDLAMIGGSETFFVDAAGELTTEYLQGAQVFVRVIAHDANQTASVDVTSAQLSSEHTGDVETMSLVETGPDTGVFEGAFDTRLGNATPGDGYLDTNENPSALERLDTLTATYTDAFSQSSDTARTIGSRMVFIDSAGNETAAYATGSRAYLRVEDQNANDPGIGQTVMVRLSSSVGDDLDVYLFETDKATGIFEGSLQLNDNPSPDSFNGSLETQSGGDIYASYSEAAGSSSSASAVITGTAVEFIDAAGVPTSELLESHVARVRVTSLGDNVDPGTSDSLTVSLDALYTADSESLLLQETGGNTNVFEGEIALSFVDPSTGTGTPGNGVVETSNSYTPAFLADQVTASFAGQSTTATTVAQRLFFIDIFGESTEIYAESGTVYLRLINHTINDPGSIDSIDAAVSVVGGGDIEQVILDETGFDTAVFEGSVVLGPGATQFDGQLDAASGDQIEAVRASTTSTLPDAVDLAMVGGSETFFVDAAGELTTEYLQGAQVFVRVIAHGANQTASVDVTSAQLSSEHTGDVETMSLVETGPDTGVFEGAFDTRLGNATPGDGYLDTNENPAALERLDTLTVSYTDAFSQSSDTARTIGSRMIFIDSAGNETAAYATGSRAYLRVEDQNANDPGLSETVMVRLSSSVGDDLDVYLFETDKATGIFEGSLQLNDSPTPDNINGVLETQAGGGIYASYSEAAGSSSSASAAITGSVVEFIDEAGQPTSELLENGSARVRVFSLADNTDPGAVDSLTVSLSSLYAADSESLLLQEIGANASVFEGEIALDFVDPSSGSGTPGNGVVETSNSFYPAFLADEVTLTFAGQSATANTVGLRLSFVDAFGQDTESYAVGGRVYLRMVSFTANLDPGVVDQVDALVTALAGGDIEQALFTETGLDTSIFEGQVDLGPGAAQFDGLLDANLGEQIEARRYASTSTLPDAVDLATIGGSKTFFVDAAGQLTSEYLQASEAFVQVTDHSANQDPGLVDVTSVEVAAELTGDFETLSLTETGVDTGMFSGSIDLQVGSNVVGDGVLTTDTSGGINPFDTLTAIYTDAFGQSQAMATTLGSRILFIDGLGVPVTSIDSGLTAYLRVEDHAANDPALADTVMATLFSITTGDQLDVYLFETGLDTGVFEAQVGLDENPVSDTLDGLLQAVVGEEVTASHTDAYGPLSSFVAVDVVVPSNYPPSVAITAPADSSVFVGADAIAFTGTASDLEDGDLAASLAWSSDLDGAIGSGASFSANLSIGTHIITASVTDSGARQGQAVISIQVDNTPPVPVITTPTDGANFGFGVAVEMTGTASDYEDGDLSTDIQWFSDQDGFLSAGSTVFVASLSEGAHLITAMVTDSGGLSSYASVNITIDPANTAPTVTISTPASGSTFFAADSITWTGVASDIEDGDLGASLSWSSDLDGPIGSGETFAANLSIGAHVITASVTDSGGLEGSYFVNIQVDNTPPAVTITAPADGSTFNAGDSIDFTGTASDYEDGDLTVNLGWSSDVDGAIGASGGAISVSTLTVGVHVITALVIDSGSVQSSDTITVTINAGPSVSITAPADGSNSNAGASVSFVGTASDPEDGDLTASLSWSSDVDGVIGTGGTFSTSALTPGAHVITATVTDAAGFEGSDSINLTVNDGPSVSITAPADGSNSNAGDSVSFVGTASDPEDGDLTSSLSWSSDVDGVIGTGGTFSTSSLSSGPHVITASVSDAGGLSGNDTITITVNAGPSVSITSPADGSGSNAGASVSFVGTASDPEDGDLTASLSWSSDVDGVIGTGGTFSTSSLSSGPHVITASVSDAGGLSGNDTITITVNAGPSVSITAPADGSGSNAGASVSFVGTASDPEDGDLAASLSWSSNVDGVIGTGGTFSTSSLSSGTHVITASVSDAGGLSGNDTITITVNAGPSVSITAPADGSGSNAGASVSFVGTASDPEDGDLASSLSWSSNVDGVIGTGGTFSTSSLSSGTHVITASVSDAGGLSGNDTITITVNAGPSVSITAPADGSGSNAGASVSFVGTASDPEDGDLASSLSWSSNVDGVIGTGGTFSTSSLSSGTHVITASVSDAGGLSGNDTITITVNAGPSVSITAPADGSGSNAGASVSFVGTASDPEDGDLASSLSWSSNVDGVIGTGGTFSTSSLSSGTHVITASVSDAGGLQGSDTITITVNAGPSVSITAPADGSGFNTGASVSFVGTASDSEDGSLTAGLSWVSSLDGSIGTGGTFSTSSLSAGTHVITASVTDSGGIEGSDTVTITVNAGPNASITAPANGAAFNAGDSISFVGSASDPEDGDLTASLAWTSSLSGAIGSGGSFSTSLAAGTHVITASVTDSGGLQASANVTITVNAAPSAAIASPTGGSVFDQGDPVSFSGSASDPEDGDLTAGLTWTSDLDGVIGSGGSFSTSALSVGSHTVTASVNDSGGLTAIAVVSLTVQLPPVQIVLTSIGSEDGWVRESSENSNVGGKSNNTGAGSSALRPGDHKKDRQYKAIVSFDTSAIPAGATILSANLRLQRGNLKGTNPFTTHGTCWVDIQSGGFGGSTTLANGDFEAVATASQVAALSNAASNGDWSEGNLNAAGLAAVNTTGTTQLRIYFDLDDNDDSGDDYIGYYSGDNGTSSRHPQLVVTYQP